MNKIRPIELTLDVSMVEALRIRQECMDFIGSCHGIPKSKIGEVKSIKPIK